MRGAPVFSLLLCLISNVYSAPPQFPQLTFPNRHSIGHEQLKLPVYEAHNLYQTQLTDMRQVIKNHDDPANKALITAVFGEKPNTKKIKGHIDRMISHPINIKFLSTANRPQGQSITTFNDGLGFHGTFFDQSAAHRAKDMLLSVSRQQGSSDKFVMPEGSTKMAAFSESKRDHRAAFQYDGKRHFDLIKEHGSGVMHENTFAYPKFAALVEDHKRNPRPPKPPAYKRI